MCLLHILNGDDVVKWLWRSVSPTPDRFWEKFNLSTVTDRQRETGQCLLSLPVLEYCQRAVFNRTNPNFDSWLQIFSCLSLSNISLDALIVPWMRRFASHNQRKSFTAIFTPVFHSMVLFSPHTCVYSGSSRWLSWRITLVAGAKQAAM